MTKKIIIFIFGIIMAQQAFAQVNVGFKGGLNVVNTEIITSIPEYMNQTDYRPSYHVGLYSVTHLSENFFFQPELLYSNKGHSYDETSFARGGSVHLHYLNLPLLIGYQPFENFNLLLGPELGYLIAARYRLDSKSSNANFIWDNKFDFALAGGISYFFTEKMDVALRYSHGFSSVVKNLTMTDQNGNILEKNVKVQNRTFQLSLGYRIK